MYFKKLFIHSIVLVICITSIACLKKDEYYCQMSSACTCVNVNNYNIDLNGMNKTMNITTNVTLNYQPCPDDKQNPNLVAVSIHKFCSN